MKKRTFVPLLGTVCLGLLLCLGLGSCGSTPPAAQKPGSQTEQTPAANPNPAPESSANAQQEAETQPPAEAKTPSQDQLDALNKAKERAQDEQSRAKTYGADQFAGDAWNQAEDLYKTAQSNEKSDTADDAQASTDAYNKAADAYEAALKAGTPGYVQSVYDKVNKARTDAVNVGADKSLPDQLTGVDSLAQGLDTDYKQKSQAGLSDDDYSSLNQRASNLLSLYQALQDGAEASAAWDQIEKQGFEPYDPTNIQAGQDAASAALGTWKDSGNNPSDEELQSISQNAKACNTAYTTALANGWKSYVLEQRTAATSARKSALANKADVACKDDFNAGDTVYKAAEAAYAKDDYPTAAPAYINAASQFSAASDAALEKRRLAQAAIDQADQKATASEAVINAAAQTLGEPEQPAASGDTEAAPAAGGQS